MRSVILLLAGTTLAAGCALGGEHRTWTDGDEQVYEATGTVLEAPDHGPELCVNVNESFPPQCRGIPLTGWDWNAAPDAQAHAGVQWTDAAVRGTFDGERLTLTAPPGPPGDPAGPPRQSFEPACDDPEAIDPSSSDTDWSLPVDDIPQVVAAWVSNPAGDRWSGPYVVNVAVRPGHAEEAERFLRRSWLGHLCVVERDQPTIADLEEVHSRLPGVVDTTIWSSAASPLRGVVRAVVTLADDETRRAVDDAFGAGLVELESVLKPVR